jgi:hypothetical protein
VPSFHCSVCHLDKPVTPGPTTGYAINADGSRTCFDCCAVHDRIRLRDESRVILYWDGSVVTNWPDTLVIVPDRFRHGRHNIGRTRVDVWFTEEEFGSRWYGVNIGDNDVLHCRKLKERSRFA